MTVVSVRCEQLTATASTDGVDIAVTATRRTDLVADGSRWELEFVLPGRAPSSMVVTFADEAAVQAAAGRLAKRVLERWLRVVEAERALVELVREFSVEGGGS